MEESSFELLPVERIPFTESSNIQYINAFVLEEILQGKFDLSYGRRLIIDCRFAYEYAGGHIKGAVNHWTCEMIDALLFRNQTSISTALIVLYCEYSERRAPRT
jgi:rhodanese-related sulfurtransferase